MRNPHPFRSGLLATTWLVLGGCMGEIGPGAGADTTGGPSGAPVASAGAPSSSACGEGAVQVGAERIRRLTPTEYRHSLRALLADETLEPQLDSDRESIATLDAVRKMVRRRGRGRGAGCRLAQHLRQLRWDGRRLRRHAL